MAAGEGTEHRLSPPHRVLPRCCDGCADDGGGVRQDGLLQQVPPAQAEPLFGTIDPRRAITIEGAYLADWMHATLQHRPEPLLAGRSPCYPEIQFQP